MFLVGHRVPSPYKISQFKPEPKSPHLGQVGTPPRGTYKLNIDGLANVKPGPRGQGVSLEIT